MERKILMLKEEDTVWTYLQEDGEIVEIHCDRPDVDETKAVLGNIYIGKVQNIVANIGAAFIDIGGINCYYDLSQVSNAIFTNKIGNKPICIGDELVVQISREAVKTKAPTVSSNLDFTGRYAVLTTGNTRIGVSAKLPRPLREHYKEQLTSIKNDDYGIIIRTNAKDVAFETVLKEIEVLQKRYEHLKETAFYRTCFSCLESAPHMYLTELKNVYTEGLSEVLVEDYGLYTEIQEYFQNELPELSDKLKHYDDPMLSLSNLYSIRTVLDRALSERVWLKHGGYLIIQPTEALTVIDVNSGKCVSKKKNSETYLQINLEAAVEIARQLRLRNISGIIIVDFINLEDAEMQQQLLREMRRELSKDPIQTSVVDVTALQLVELTRKKVRKPLHECVNFNQ